MKIMNRSAFLLAFLLATASAAPTKEEQQLNTSARQSLADGQFDLADARFQTFFKKFPNSDLATESRFYHAQALFFLGRYDTSNAVLSSGSIADSLKDDASLLQSELAIARENWTEAEQRCRSFLEAYPKSGKAPQARLDLAWALAKLNRPKEANALFDEIAKSDPPIAAKARMARAKAFAADKKYPEAISALQTLLDSKPAPGLMFEANYWLAEILYQSSQAAAALEAYQKITGNEKAFPKDLVAKAWFGQGRAQQAIQQPEAAQKSFQKAYTLGESESLKLSAFNQYLESAKTQKRLDEAVAELRDFAKNNTTRPNAAAALYAIGLAQSESGDADKAVGTLEALLTAYPQSRWRLPATYELGKLYQQIKQPELAVKAFRSATEGNDNPDLTRKAAFQLGELYFSQKDYLPAAQQYEKAASQPGASENERALFNQLLALSQLGQLEAFNKTYDRFASDFPASPLLDKLTLEKAALQTRQSKPEDAQATFEKALAGSANAATSPLLLLRLGDLYYNKADYDNALKSYEQLTAKFPADPLVGQALYRGLLTSLNSGKLNNEQARLALQNLLQTNKTEPLAPQILFTLGELHYNQQRFAEAQAQFEQLAKDFPRNPDVDEARYWASKAALAREDYPGALPILEKIADTSPRKIEARLLQARIYREQLKFSNALTLLSEVLDVEKSGERYVDAILLKGDCYFALGKDNKSQYEAAANAYGTLLTSPSGTFAQRNEAGYKRALSFQMLGRTDDALALYLDVVAGRLAVDPPKANAPLPPEYLWTIQSGVKAAQIRETKQDWRGAISLYRRLEALGLPTQSQKEIRDSINKIRRDNFIYDES